MYICFLFSSGMRISHKNRHIPEFLLYKFSHGLSLTSQHTSSNITPLPENSPPTLPQRAFRWSRRLFGLLPVLPSYYQAWKMHAIDVYIVCNIIRMYKYIYTISEWTTWTSWTHNESKRQRIDICIATWYFQLFKWFAPSLQEWM